MSIQQFLMTTASGGTFQPDDITGLVAWWDASDESTFTLTGSAVDRWYDKVLITRYGEQTTAGAKPAWSSTARNSKPGVTFDGGDRLPLSAITDLPTGQSNSVIFVVGYTVYYLNWSKVIAWGGTSGTYPMRAIGTTATDGFHTWDGWGTPDSNSAMQWSGDNLVYQAILKTGTDMYPKYHINGSSTANTGTTLVGATTSTSRGTIGDAATTTDAGENWNGVVQEILVYNEELSDTDRQKVEGYAAHKWALTSLLPSDHPYKSVAP